MNLSRELIAFEKEHNDTILCGVIGKAPDNAPRVRDQFTILSREDLLENLNYEFNGGHGGIQCHAMITWTSNYVLSIIEYEGAAILTHLPRNPVLCCPGYL